MTGARGRPPTPTLKVSATWHDGYRVIGTLTIGGYEAASKAERTGEAILARVRRLLAARGLPYFSETSIEVLGAESMYGPWRHPAAKTSREVVLKIGARHRDQEALEVLAREIFPPGSSMAQGITGFFAGRPSVQPVLTAVFISVVQRQSLSGGAYRRRRGGRSVRGFAAFVAAGGDAGVAKSDWRCRRQGAVDRVGGWPQRRQGQFRQYRPDRAQAANICRGCARR